MRSLLNMLTSTVAQKYLMALTGLGLFGFLVVHLAGNFSLLFPDSTIFNAYANNLHELGLLLEIAEIGLLVLFGLHILTAVKVTIDNKKARPISYEKTQIKNGAKRSSLASKTMIVSGIFVLAFLILHLKQFTWGPGIAEGYVTTIDGQKVRDLYRLVSETFQNPLFVSIYSIAMILLGFHLRHGFWSLFQSLGVIKPSVSDFLYHLAVVVAVLIAVGFLSIPLVVFLRG